MQELQLLYTHVQSDSITADGKKFIVAEAEKDGRRHKRLIGASNSLAQLCGRPILYSDTYAGYNDRFVYARHQAVPMRFFQELDRFYFDRLPSFSELEGREFEVFISDERESRSEMFELPISVKGLEYEDIRFFRIKFPFGELAIEFGRESRSPANEMNSLKERKLPFLAESPLIGYSAENSNILAPLLARLHWASGLLSTKILEELIAELSTDAVPA